MLASSRDYRVLVILVTPFRGRATHERCERGRPELRVCVIGAFRVLTHDGQDLTPRGRKARALLAILALNSDPPPVAAGTAGQIVERPRARTGRREPRPDLDRNPQHLRRALPRLPSRRHAWDRARRGPGKRRSRHRRLVRICPGGRGAGIAGRHRGRRPGIRGLAAQPAGRVEQRIASSKPSVIQTRPAPARPWLRILAPLLLQAKAACFFPASSGTVSPRDWSISGASRGATTERYRGVRLAWMPCRSREVAVNVALLSADGALQLWSESDRFRSKRVVSDAPPLQALINRAVDVAAQYLNRTGSSPEAGAAFGQAFEAVQRMFKIELAEVDARRRAARQRYEADPRPVYLAWRAYAARFMSANSTIGATFSRKRKSLPDRQSRPIRTMPPFSRWHLTLWLRPAQMGVCPPAGQRVSGTIPRFRSGTRIWVRPSWSLANVSQATAKHAAGWSCAASAISAYAVQGIRLGLHWRPRFDEALRAAESSNDGPDLSPATALPGAALPAARGARQGAGCF